MRHRRASKHQLKKLDAAFARADREAALRDQNGRCAYCLDPLSYKEVTRDHVVPRSAGGLDHRSNTAAACAPCNKAKGSMAVELFKRMISDPRPGEPMKFRMIWVSRRLNKALIDLEKRIMRRLGRKA
ncbi:HNH endonuclease [Ensifer sp. MPMI2T]|nr:HNH endonuclease [Ensifer sp. MPMI2T]